MYYFSYIEKSIFNCFLYNKIIIVFIIACYSIFNYMINNDYYLINYLFYKYHFIYFIIKTKINTFLHNNIL